MASLLIIYTLLFLSIFSFTSSTPAPKSPLHPKGLLLPITKDKTTLQYTTIIHQRTPHIPASVVFDLGGRGFWVDCDKDYVSSSYKAAQCGSAECKRASFKDCTRCTPQRPGCNINSCSSIPFNPILGYGNGGEIASDVVSLQSTDGSNPGQVVTIPNLSFDCGNTKLLDQLAKGTVGVAGFGRHTAGLPLQFASALSLKKKFAVCLTSGKGVALFGDVPYKLLPNIQISNLETTPLVINPVSHVPASKNHEKSPEYYIGVTDIKIADKSVSLNKTKLNIDGVTGFGGTKISTMHPYTVMETSMFNAFMSEFIRAAAAVKITRVSSVAPFSACFSAKNVPATRLGYAVPEIQLVLQGNVVWRITGSNSVVSVSKDVICLGFVDGGVEMKVSVAIGGLQLEDNLIEFDLVTNKFGFSSSLLGRRTSCANFNFTSTA